MGQKVNPHGLRVGVIKIGMPNGMHQKDFADTLLEDHGIRELLKKKLYAASQDRNRAGCQ